MNERVILKLPKQNTQPEPSADVPEEPAADGSGLSLDEPAEDPAPAPDQQPAPEAPAGEGANKMVQQLTGQLGQQIRTAQDVTSDDIKGAVNSILAAAKGKLQPDAVSDIQKKLNDAVGTASAEPAPQGTEQPVAEEEVLVEDGDIMHDGFIQDLVRRAGLTKAVAEFPEGVAFDICEGIYMFVLDYNDGTDFIIKLKGILNKNHFRAKPDITDFSDLTQSGQAVYQALVQLEDEILNPRAQNRSQLKPQSGGFALNEAQKKFLFSRIHK